MFNFQLPTREGLTTPRSARASVGRRPTTLPHQRFKKEVRFMCALNGILPNLLVSPIRINT